MTTKPSTVRMNFPRYSKLYSLFHGCQTFRNVEDLIVLDFADAPFEPLAVKLMYEYDTIHMNTQKAFTQALKAFFNTEDPISVTCHPNNFWVALLGSFKTITPSLEKDATFQMYATPYFVNDPAIVSEYWRGIARQAYDFVFSYKSCIMYLDREDLPCPGGNYFDATRCNSWYRVCILSKEPAHIVLSVAQEWKQLVHKNMQVEIRSYLTKDVIATPKMIHFTKVNKPYLPEERRINSRFIQKRLPQFLLQDILGSYYRNYLHDNNGKENERILDELGLIVEFPFRIAFEGTRNDLTTPKEYVALTVNGRHPKRCLLIQSPYDVYSEYQEVPVTLWTPIHYVNTFLNLPMDMEKVIVDSVVIGYVYKQGFFCFSYPVLEGRPSKESKRNIECILNPVTLSDEFFVKETYRVDQQYSLHRIQQKGVPYPAWCVTEAKESDQFPENRSLPELPKQWLSMFTNKSYRKPNFVDVNVIQIALMLARHKICFKTHISDKKKGFVLTDNEIQLRMDQSEVDFINGMKVLVPQDIREDPGSCTIC